MTTPDIFLSYNREDAPLGGLALGAGRGDDCGSVFVPWIKELGLTDFAVCKGFVSMRLPLDDRLRIVPDVLNLPGYAWPEMSRSIAAARCDRPDG